MPSLKIPDAAGNFKLAVADLWPIKVQEANLTRYQHFRAICSLGLPLILGNIAQISIGVVDTVMTGWYSVEALAALVLGSSFFFVVFILGAGFGHAVLPLVASAAAREDAVQIRRVTRMGLWLSILYSTGVFSLFWGSEFVFIALGQDPILAGLAQNYLRILSFGLIPALVVLVLKNYLAALELTQVVLVITVAALLLNIPLNYMLIFGKYGAPELGVGGAAWASLAVHLLSALAIAFYAWWRLPEHKLFLRFWRPDWGIFSKLFKIGMPIGLTHLAEAGLFYASSVMMGWLGVIALAAHGIALQISSVTFVVHLGLAAAATVRAGAAYGRKDFVGLREGAVVATLASIGLSTMTLILFVTFPTVLVGLFIDAHDPARDQILALGAILLVVSGLFQFVDGGQVMALSLLRGIQDTSVPLLVAVIGYWAIGLPVGYVLGFWLGFDGVGIWAGIAVGLAIVALTLGHRFVKLLGQMLDRNVLRTNSGAVSN